MKKTLLFILFSGIYNAQAPAGYYDAAEGLSGYALKSKLHDIISKNTVSWNYDDLKVFPDQTDVDRYYDKDNTMLDYYTKFPQGGSKFKYDIAQITGNGKAEGDGWNREHVMPQSTFYSDYPMYSDIFYIFPADAYINQRRSNNPYGIVSTKPSYTFSNGTKIGPSVTPGKTGTVFEPIDEFKGDIARMLLYFVVRYEGKLNTFTWAKSPNPLSGNEELGFEQWYINQLVLWSNQDPVSQAEIDRNNAIYKLQNNRNPFIDHPEWVNSVWKTDITSATPVKPTVTIADTGARFVRLTWNPTQSALGYKIMLNGKQVATTNSTSYDLGRLTASTTYTIDVIAYNGIYKEAQPATITATTLASDDYATDLMITKYVEGTGYNKALEITNNTGYDVDLKQYKVGTQSTSTSIDKVTGESKDNYFTNGYYQLEGTLKKGEKLVVMNNKANFPNYDMNKADVKTNSNALNFSGWQYVELGYMNDPADKYPQTVDAVGYFGQKNDYAKDISLYRNVEISNPNNRFNTSEWTTYPTNYIAGLGQVLSVNNVKSEDILAIYPNPVSQGVVYVSGKNLSKITTARIIDISGKLVKEIQNPFRNDNSINVQELNTGLYILQINGQNLKFLKR